MRTRRTKPLTRQGADQVLDGETTTLPTVARLLAAAAAEDGTGDAVPGDAQALAAFRQAQPVTPVRPRKWASARAAVVTALSTKLALALGAVAVAATGTVAITSTDVLPDRPAHHGPTASTPPSPGPPSPAHAGLCTAFEHAADAAGSPVRAARQPAFAGLVSAAGGVDRVAAYCAGLPSAGRPTGKPSDLPTPGPAQPTRRPTDLPTPGPAQPSRRPSDLPTPDPAQPTRKPADLPTPDHPRPTDRPSDVPAARP